MNDFNINTNPKITSGFTTPDNYFENFNDRLMGKLPTHEPKVISFYAKNRNWFYSAAAILVIAFTIPVMNLWKTDTEISYTSEIENYITNHSTITDDDLVNLLDEEDIAKLKSETSIDVSQEDILSENTNVEEYILN